MDKKINFKKQKIFFVYPPTHVNNRCGNCMLPNTQTIFNSPLLPFDMMSLSSIAKKRGYETKFSDYSINNESIYDFLRDLRVFKPDFLVLNVSAQKLEEDLSLLTQAEDLLEDIVVIAKGAVFDFNSYSIMQKYPQIDIALKEENEKAFDEIIRYNDLKEIQGITYQINNKIVSTPNRPTENNIDYLPVLDRDLINNSLYIRPDTKKCQTAIVVSKGCGENCLSCFSSSMDEKIVRYKSSELVIKEIKECIEKYSIRDFVFIADFFNFDNNWVQKLCRQIIENNLKINFSTNIKTDTLDSKTLNLMRKAGCYMVSLNIKSASQDKLNKTNKKIAEQKTKEAIKKLNEAKIQIFARYAVGFPCETKETLDETYKFAKELNTQYAVFYSEVALKGTKYYDLIAKSRLSKINHQNPYIFSTINSYALTAQEIFAQVRKFNRDYYLRPDYILKMAMNINSFTKLRSYCDAVATFAKK